MTITLVFTLALTFSFADSAPAAPDAALPEELSSLQELWGDEEKLIDGVRQFDLVQQALADWDADQLAPQYAQAGDLELAKQKQQEARHRLEVIQRAYEEVLKRYPDNARARIYLGELLYDRYGKHDEGLRLWQEAAKLDPKQPEVWNDLAIHYSHVGELDKALDYYDKALALDPNNADFLYNIVQVYLTYWPDVERHYKWSRAQLFRKAMEYSKKAIELRPDNYPMLQNYAENYFVGGENMKLPVNWEDAAAAWQKVRESAREKDETFNAYMWEARAWLRANRKDQAAKCLEEALKLYPKSQVAQRLLAEVKPGA